MNDKHIDLFDYQLQRRRISEEIDLALLENQKSLEEIGRCLEEIGERADRLQKKARRGA
jgi:hypothetical protein